MITSAQASEMIRGSLRSLAASISALATALWNSPTTPTALASASRFIAAVPSSGRPRVSSTWSLIGLPRIFPISATAISIAFFISTPLSAAPGADSGATPPTTIGSCVQPRDPPIRASGTTSPIIIKIFFIAFPSSQSLLILVNWTDPFRFTPHAIRSPPFFLPST